MGTTLVKETQMSEQNKRLAQRLTEEVWSAANLDVVDEIVAGNYVRHGHNKISGADAFRQTVAETHETFGAFNVSTEDQVSENAKVVTRWTATGTQEREFMGLPPSGKRFHIDGITISRIEDGKITEEWAMWDAVGMMKQLES
jgi:steroid delta-isomerase-like uncharacterized protein